MIGTVLSNRFELTGLVSDRAIFAVYSARDRTSNRDVVVRVIKPPFNNHPGFQEALQEVADKYGMVRSQNVEPIQEVGRDDDLVYMVSDLTRGPSLADRIKKLAPFSVPVSVSIGISICQALEAVHRNLLAHGDLAPQNVAVLANGDVKLQLTGVWEVYGVSPTAGAMVLPGMSPYLAPEISAGGMPSARGDVYALGVILYELLTGRLPYYADTPVAIALQHANAATPSVREINPSVPVVLDEIVKKAMAKDPEHRYANAGELMADLRLMQDALRFGRSLSWPLRPETTPTGTTAAKRGSGSPSGKTAEPQPVAPRMSALRTDEEYETSTRKARKERDVPVWMTMTIVFLVAVVLSLVGVWMLMNLNRPQLVPIPNVVGLTSQEARDVLNSSGLQLKVASRLPSEKIEMDHVIDVNPAAGERVREGSSVSVSLSSGSRYVAVPDLKGLTVDRARTVLSSLNLEMDAEMMREGDATIEPGNVVRTIPAAKSRIERNSRVKLVLSAGRSTGGGSGLPNRTGYLYTIHIVLDDLRSATAVRIDMRDTDGTRTIFDEVRNPGDRIDVSAIGQQKEATFEIFYNDRRVKEVPAEAEEAQ